MTDEKVDLTQGGIATILVGTTGMVDEYKHHPQVSFIDCKVVKADELTNEVASNTRIFILAGEISKYHYMWVTAYSRTKKVPFILRKSNQAVYDAIKSFFPNGNGVKPTVEEVKQIQQHGKLTQFVPLIDFSKSNTENARIILNKAREKGVITTEASLAQLVSNQRRKQSGTGIVRSARPKLDLSVELLENMIKELEDMKEFLIATVEENRLLKTKLDKFRKAMEE